MARRVARQKLHRWADLAESASAHHVLLKTFPFHARGQVVEPLGAALALGARLVRRLVCRLVRRPGVSAAGPSIEPFPEVRILVLDAFRAPVVQLSSVARVIRNWVSKPLDKQRGRARGWDQTRALTARAFTAVLTAVLTAVFTAVLT